MPIQVLAHAGSFTWNTTSFAKGNYTIDAYAPPVPNEMDTTDNTSLTA